LQSDVCQQLLASRLALRTELLRTLSEVVDADPRFRDRIQIVRLAARERRHQEIAEHLTITPRTVQRWLNAFLEHGLDGLRPRKAPGKPGKIPAFLADEVKRWVIEGEGSVFPPRP
jgi:hypothetical protein